jgi:hypothetical protein
MILAQELSKLVTLDRNELSKILADSGYTGISFNSVKFLGLTNSGTFCYSVQYFDESGTGEVEIAKVYVNKNTTGNLVADF